MRYARFAAAFVVAWLSSGWTSVRGNSAYECFGRLSAESRNLIYLNPERDYSRPKLESLDDALRLFRGNLETDRYMRDSVGIAQAHFEIYGVSAEACDSLRDRVVGILQSVRLQFRTGAADRMELGPAEGYWLNPGPIPVASAYFALRDSLVHLRTGKFQVMVKESPYRSPLTFDGDSALAFLTKLRDLTRRENRGFQKRLLETMRLAGLDYGFTRGVDCSIAVGRLLSPKEKREKPPAQLSDVIPFRLPSRDQPIVVRMDSIQALTWISLGLSAAGFLMSISFWSAFTIRRWRKRRVSTPAGG